MSFIEKWVLDDNRGKRLPREVGTSDGSLLLPIITGHFIITTNYANAYEFQGLRQESGLVFVLKLHLVGRRGMTFHYSIAQLILIKCLSTRYEQAIESRPSAASGHSANGQTLGA